MFDWIQQLIRDTPATYPIEATAVAVDGFFPVVPGESVVITAAIVAAGGGLSLILVFASAWLAGEVVRRASETGEDEEAAARDVDTILGED